MQSCLSSIGKMPKWKKKKKQDVKLYMQYNNMKYLEKKIGRKYAKMLTVVIPGGGLMGYIFFWFFIQFCTF